MIQGYAFALRNYVKLVAQGAPGAPYMASNARPT
jgi:hypothetical protein